MHWCSECGSMSLCLKTEVMTHSVPLHASVWNHVYSKWSCSFVEHLKMVCSGASRMMTQSKKDRLCWSSSLHFTKHYFYSICLYYYPIKYNITICIALSYKMHFSKKELSPTLAIFSHHLAKMLCSHMPRHYVSWQSLYLTRAITTFFQW